MKRRITALLLCLALLLAFTGCDPQGGDTPPADGADQNGAAGDNGNNKEENAAGNGENTADGTQNGENEDAEDAAPPADDKENGDQGDGSEPPVGGDVDFPRVPLG